MAQEVRANKKFRSPTLAAGGGETWCELVTRRGEQHALKEQRPLAQKPVRQTYCHVLAGLPMSILGRPLRYQVTLVSDVLLVRREPDPAPRAAFLLRGVGVDRKGKVVSIATEAVSGPGLLSLQFADDLEAEGWRRCVHDASQFWEDTKGLLRPTSPEQKMAQQWRRAARRKRSRQPQAFCNVVGEEVPFPMEPDTSPRNTKSARYWPAWCQCQCLRRVEPDPRPDRSQRLRAAPESCQCCTCHLRVAMPVVREFQAHANLARIVANHVRVRSVLWSLWCNAAKMRHSSASLGCPPDLEGWDLMS